MGTSRASKNVIYRAMGKMKYVSDHGLRNLKSGIGELRRNRSTGKQIMMNAGKTMMYKTMDEGMKKLNRK